MQSVKDYAICARRAVERFGEAKGHDARTAPITNARVQYIRKKVFTDEALSLSRVSFNPAESVLHSQNETCRQHVQVGAVEALVLPGPVLVGAHDPRHRPAVAGLALAAPGPLIAPAKFAETIICDTFLWRAEMTLWPIPNSSPG